MAVRGSWLAACAGIVLCTSPAQAYCRTHTQDPAASSCPELCLERGLPLYWPKPNLSYTFNEREFPEIDDAALRTIFARSFATWSNVRCDGTPVGLRARAAANTTTLEVGPEEDEPNANVIVHYDAEEWDDQRLPDKAFAITAVWFNSKTGAILGADMMFNGGMDPFGECSDSGCFGANAPRTDLRNVATHEIGHFLGLSHSAVEGSTMWCDAEPREVSKRTLAQDDVDGLCDIYPPGEAFKSFENDGGSCSAGSRQGGMFSALALGVALVIRRRRRR